MTIGTSIAEAKDYLKKGGIVAIPTETVYGLAGNALNEDAILSIFKAKNRPHFDPLIVHVSSMDEVNKYAYLPQKLEPLAKAIWPGPLTLLLKKKSIIPDLVTAGSDLVAMRIPKHPTSLQLLSLLDFPLVAPSANPFGYVSPTNPSHVAKNLPSVDYILDGGTCQLGIESTIVGLINNQIFLYRLGATSIEQIEQICKEKVQVQIQNNSNPKAPGMLDKHYSPSCQLSIYSEMKNTKEAIDASIIWFGDNPPKGFKKVYQLSKSQSLEEAAKNLFSTLRLLDEHETKKAIIKLVPDQGIGRAINDRIKRACTR